MSQTTEISNLVINKLTKEQYENITPSPTQLYFVTDDDGPSQIEYSAGSGLSLNDTTFNHSNSITAGTAGGTSATSGASISIPYITYDTEGHISAAGTKTHTVDGFALSTHSHGDISSAGDITATATIASGDRLVINDESASKVTNSSITFGTNTATFLRNDGTWADPTSNSFQILTGNTAPTSSQGNNGDIYLLLDGTSLGSIVYSVVNE